MSDFNGRITDDVIEDFKKIEDGVVGGYKKIEEGIVGAYKRVEDKFVATFLTHEGETVKDAKKRLAEEQSACEKAVKEAAENRK